MTTATKAPARVACPHCKYTAEPGSSIAGHVAMAHPDVPMDEIAPKRPAPVEQAGNIANGEQLADQVVTPRRSARNGTQHVPAAPAVSPPAAGAATLAEIPLDLVDVGANVRVDVAELEELAASIAEHGVLQPVKVTPVAGGRYRLVWGQRRTLAARQAGLATIPAIVADEDLAEASPKRSVEQLVENLHRADLNPIDRARAMREVVDSGVSQADLARKLGIAPSTVANDLRLLTLDDTVVEKLLNGEITASHGKAIASLPAKHQRELAIRIHQSKLSAHQIETELQWRRATAEGEVASAERTTKQIPKLLAALEAGVPKDVSVYLLGPYNMDADELKKAVKKAGWTLTDRYAQERPAKGECDCAVVRVELNRTWKVEPGCVDHAHFDRQRNLDQRNRTEVAQAFEARLALIAGELERQLVAAAFPEPILRILHGALVSYIGTDYAAWAIDGPRAIAQQVVRQWRVREMATPELLAELGLEASS